MHISAMKTKMTRVKKTRQLKLCKRQIMHAKKHDGGRDGEFTDSKGKEEGPSLTPAALNSENLILGENGLEEQGADNTQGVDTPEDNNIDRNGDVTAAPIKYIAEMEAPDKNMAETGAPVEQSGRPQHSRCPPERLACCVPGQPGYFQSTAVCTMCAQRFQTQLLYTPLSYLPQPNEMMYLYMN